VESAFAYETDVANFHGAIQSHGIGHPEGMSVRRILARKLRAKDVVVGHRWWWQE